MLVKCRYCGDKHERNEMYKVVVNNKNEYYCNGDEYITVQKNKEYKSQTYNIINEIFGYKVINTLLFKELKTIVALSSYENLYGYLNHNINQLKQIMNKQFNNEVGKIRYFSAIVKNNITDYIEVENDVTTVTYDINDIEKTKYKPKQRRKCIMDYLKEV